MPDNPTTALSDYERGYRDGVAVAAEDIKRLRARVEAGRDFQLGYYAEAASHLRSATLILDDLTKKEKNNAR